MKGKNRRVLAEMQEENRRILPQTTQTDTNPSFDIFSYSKEIPVCYLCFLRS